MYAHVSNGIIDDVADLPPGIYYDGTRWWDLRTMDPATIIAAGWLIVLEAEQPPNSEAGTHVPSYELVDGQPVQVWIPRPWTAEELEDYLAGVVSDELVEDAIADLAKVRAAIDNLGVLLGDQATAGSVRQWRAGVTGSYSAASMRALADLMITDMQATRRVARQTLRIARLLVNELGSSDVGNDI